MTVKWPGWKTGKKTAEYLFLHTGSMVTETLGVAELSPGGTGQDLLSLNCYPHILGGVATHCTLLLAIQQTELWWGNGMPFLRIFSKCKQIWKFYPTPQFIKMKYWKCYSY